MVESDKQALTKVEFGNRKNFNETEEDFVELGQKNKIQKKLNATGGNKTTNTLNTFDTFKSYDEVDSYKNKKT